MDKVKVLLGLFTFEFLDSNLAVINGQEIDELFVVFDVFVGNLNRCLKLEDLILLSRLALEDGFQSCLALRQLFDLLLIISLLSFSGKLLLNNKLSTMQCITHTLEI